MPLAPSVGGIATWGKIVSSYRQSDFEMFYVDSSISQVSKNPQSRNNIFVRVWTGIKASIKTIKSFKQCLRNNEIYLVHLTSSGSLGFFKDSKIIKICNKKHIKIVYHFHFGRIPLLLKAKNWEYRKMIKNCKKVDSIITIDELSTISLKKIFNNVIYIPNPIKKNNTECNIRSHNIIFLGWVIRSKGVMELLEAWSELSKRYSDWKLTIVGPINDNFLNSLSPSLISNSSLFFTGSLSHESAMKKLQESSILILPSYSEGFPNVILEAMMCGVAIVGTNVGAIPEMISEKSGLLIKPKSVENIIESLSKLMSSDEERIEIGHNAKKRVISLYEADKVCFQYLSLWKNLTN